jgi:hypothetical protein
MAPKIWVQKLSSVKIHTKTCGRYAHTTRIMGLTRLSTTLLRLPRWKNAKNTKESLEGVHKSD